MYEGWIRFVLVNLLLYSTCFSYAQPAGYYIGVEGKNGEELLAALHDIIDDHKVLSYSSLWTAFQTTDMKEDGTVWDMYSDLPGGPPPYSFTFGSDQCGNYSGESSCYNREHSFPKSWFNDDPPMNTDLFHVYPTDGYVNGKRSNYPFGETDNPNWTSQNGSQVGSSSIEGFSGTVFEPIDEYKGDFARTYFYMAVRYFEEDTNWPGSGMVDGSQLKPWARDMLVLWHENDPVSTKETDRNEAVYALQGNRNPFIDHPEYVYLIYSNEIVDKTAPNLDSIRVISSQSMKLFFNEALDSLSATNKDNYIISEDIDVLGASFSNAQNSSIDLTTSNFQSGNYSISISGVSDTSGNEMHLSSYSFTMNLVERVSFIATAPVLLFPNPSDGNLTISLEDEASLRYIQLIDQSGRIAFSESDFSGSKAPLELFGLAPGVYFLEIKLEDSSKRYGKIILN